MVKPLVFPKPPFLKVTDFVALVVNTTCGANDKLVVERIALGGTCGGGHVLRGATKAAANADANVKILGFMTILLAELPLPKPLHAGLRSGLAHLAAKDLAAKERCCGRAQGEAEQQTAISLEVRPISFPDWVRSPLE